MIFRYKYGENKTGDPSFRDKFLMFMKTLLQCSAKAIPAPLAWLMVGLLRGEHVTCALWPVRDGMVDMEFPACADETFPLPCQVPKTYEKIVEGCGAVIFLG